MCSLPFFNVLCRAGSERKMLTRPKNQQIHYLISASRDSIKLEELQQYLNKELKEKEVLEEEHEEVLSKWRSMEHALSETKAQLALETETVEALQKSKKEVELRNEELRMQVLEEQRERNTVTYENEKLCADFEALRAKVKETISVQQEQRGAAESLRKENSAIARELQEKTASHKELTDSLITQYEIVAQFKVGCPQDDVCASSGVWRLARTSLQRKI